ncbi:MAG: UMP kinase [Sphingomonadaceae bacterium]|nr:UMP kinase [Sphingomonadaceae bacterium]
MSRPRFKRILLKLSGEVLMGEGGLSIDPASTARVAGEIADARRQGFELCVVVGGGNIFRGIAAAAKGFERATADYMGMLATVMNALAVQNALEQIGVDTRVQSAIPMSSVCEPYIRRRAERHIEKGRVVIFAAGTGSPYFTTDTGAALRAAEMKCDALFKGTSVDGVYDADPKMVPGATRYDTVTYDRVLADNLKVMDASAIALCRDNDIPIVVFNIRERGNLARVLDGEGVATVVGTTEAEIIPFDSGEISVELKKPAQLRHERKNKPVIERGARAIDLSDSPDRETN